MRNCSADGSPWPGGLERLQIGPDTEPAGAGDGDRGCSGPFGRTGCGLLAEYEIFPDTDVHLPSGWVDYCLEDGTVLLREQDLYPPALPETLPEQVRQSIQNHYARQGRRYSAESLLQGAYAE